MSKSVAPKYEKPVFEDLPIYAPKSQRLHNFMWSDVDITVFGSGADGILFTGEQLIVKPTFADPVAIKFNEMVTVRFEETNPKFPHVIVVTKEEKFKLENIID